ncbi:MAG: nucleotidyltransferase family protein [Anaerolineae bacterium]
MNTKRTPIPVRAKSKPPVGAITKPPVGAIVLAAGASRRMGQPKQLLPIDGQPMVRLVTEAACAAGLAQVVVVLGAHAADVAVALEGLPVGLVVNEDWREGMSTSLGVGLGALRPEIAAALLVLADQPDLSPELLRALVARYRATGAPLVAPYHGGRRGNPVLFDRALFAELEAVTGDRGGRSVVARHEAELERVEVQDPAVVSDVDTPQDYEALAQR